MNNYVIQTKSTLPEMDDTPIQVSVNTEGLTTEQIEALARLEIVRMVNDKLRKCAKGKLGQDGRAFRETAIREKKMSFHVSSELSGSKVPMTTETMIALIANSGMDLDDITAALKEKLGQ